MKFCHFGDSHIGAGGNYPRRGESGLTLRQEDILRSFVESIDRMIEIRPDFCIHAGDIFDSVRPTNRIMALVGEELHRLACIAEIPTVIIAGNHDAPKQPHVGAAIEVYAKIPNLYPVASSKLEVIQIGETAIFALPHCLTTEIQQQELARLVPDPDSKFNVMIAHGVAAGMPEFSMADLGEQELPVNLLDRFDYAALGHFHNSCQVSKKGWYSGSTERLSQSERDSEKGFLEVNLDPFDVKFHAVETRPMIDMQPIDASGKRGDELAEMIREKVNGCDSSDKIVRVKVKGVSEETLKTLPSHVISDLKQESWSLDISFEKEDRGEERVAVGRSAIGRIDEGFIEFIETADLSGFDKDKLRKDALVYLSQED